MLQPTRALIGYFGNDAPPLLTDGRFSGGSRGILVAHLDDYYKKDSFIKLVKNGDKITINTEKNSINVNIHEDELKYRQRFKYFSDKPEFKNGYLNLYSKYVGDITNGFIIE